MSFRVINELSLFMHDKHKLHNINIVSIIHRYYLYSFKDLIHDTTPLSVPFSVWINTTSKI